MDIAVKNLEPHPQALMCAALADGEERAAADAAIEASVASDGIKVPLAVARAEGSKTRFWVIDGTSRLAAAKAAGLDAVPCEVLDLADERAVGEEIYRRNALRKPFTASQRIMLYVNIHLGEILESCAGKRGRPKNAPRGAFSTTEGIADKIGVSRNDVASAIELARCVNARAVPADDAGGVREATEEEAKRLDAVYDEVIHGHTPVRRWKPAFEGMASASGGKGAVNYVKLGLRTVTSLRTVFTGWQNIKPAERGPVLDILWAALCEAPDDVVKLIRDRFDGEAAR